ncbi:glycoside hydrolase family 16 protein [Sphaerimonospora sp. CA-214678]|uniref:glycoside hydrolase family 16 protein n=1 Tax=Sphaerimonospora sp. CA-214678 TaxID=3240029 RepID=UPI003D8FD393
MGRRRSLLRLVTAIALAGSAMVALTPASAAATWETVIGPSSFNDYNALATEWAYLYPWGSDHNGSARMYGSATDHNHVSLSGGVLTLRAARINWDEGTSSSSPHLPIRYHSGAVHARDQVVVNDQFPNWEVKGDFQAPSARGTWPAFWLTGVNSWPPESDILEFKGDSRNWFNTFRTSSDVDSTIVGVSSPGSWHNYRAWITKVSATDVDIHYYIDGQWKAVHHARGFVGRPMWLIINLQMEGSSGSPGPSADTYYRARDIYVGRSRNY